MIDWPTRGRFISQIDWDLEGETCIECGKPATVIYEDVDGRVHYCDEHDPAQEATAMPANPQPASPSSVGASSAGASTVISRKEFAGRLDDEGHPTAAGAILDGADYADATAYLRGGLCRYDDAESRWLQAFIDAGCVEPTDAQIAAVRCEPDDDWEVAG